MTNFLQRGRDAIATLFAPSPESMLKAVKVTHDAAKDAADHYADEQGSIVSSAFAVMSGQYRSEIRQGISDKTGATYGMLRRWVAACPCASAIVSTRKDQIAAFCQPVETRWGFADRPGFRVRMRSRRTEASKSDEAEIEMWTNFFADAGFCPPPIAERPVGWQPGLEYVVRCLTDDSLILDNAPLRTWQDKANGSRFPVVSFAPDDGGTIRRTHRTLTGQEQDGTAVTEPYDATRTNTKKEVAFVRLGEGGAVGISEEFTASEMAIWSRNPRSDIRLQGYGVSEAEMAVNTLSDLLATGEYNSSRFKKDSLPRGVLLLKGAVDEKQMQQFRMSWVQNLRGLANRWNFPILKAPADDKGGVEWITMDNVPRDMEYSQLRYNLIIDIHALFGMHPEETGYGATSPYRPPLSEASPEARLKHSQESGLTPILRSLAQFFNHAVLWKADKERRFVFEWVGLDEENALEDEQLVSIMYQNGAMTPRRYFEARDMKPPAPFIDHPALDLPMPLQAGLQYIESMRQAQIQDEERERGHAMEEMQMEQGQGGAPGQVPPGDSAPPQGTVPGQGGVSAPPPGNEPVQETEVPGNRQESPPQAPDEPFGESGEPEGEPAAVPDEPETNAPEPYSKQSRTVRVRKGLIDPVTAPRPFELI